MADLQDKKDSPQITPSSRLGDSKQYAPDRMMTSESQPQPLVGGDSQAVFFMDYQSFIDNLQKLLQAGHDPEDIQKRWQIYYDTLDDYSKQSAWRYMQDSARRHQALAQPQTPTPSPPQQPAGVEPVAASFAETPPPQPLSENQDFVSPLSEAETPLGKPAHLDVVSALKFKKAAPSLAPVKTSGLGEANYRMRDARKRPSVFELLKKYKTSTKARLSRVSAKVAPTEASPPPQPEKTQNVQVVNPATDLGTPPLPTVAPAGLIRVPDPTDITATLNVQPTDDAPPAPLPPTEKIPFDTKPTLAPEPTAAPVVEEQDPGSIKLVSDLQVPPAIQAESVSTPQEAAAPSLVTESSSPQAIAASQTVNSPSLQGDIQELLPDKKIKHKARNIFNWNSSTALFDKEERREIKRQNLKSVVFGLSFAALLCSVFFFTFFHERIIQPFIKPASYNSEVQAIIPPGGRAISDPAWKVIVPKLGIAPPVVGGVEPYRSKNRNESDAVFERRIQKALEGGVVHYPSTPLPGQSVNNKKSNVVIVGHSSSSLFTPGDYKSVFSSLRNLKVGDLILVNYKKTQYVYKIYGKHIILPKQVEFLGPASRDHSLTLITCDPPGSTAKRLVLIAQQISPNPNGNQYVDAQTNNTDGIIVPGNSRRLFGS